MRGLVGERLLKLFFAGVVGRPGFDSPQVLDPKFDNGEAAAQGSYDFKPEKAQGECASEGPVAANEVTRSSDPED